MDVQFGTRKSTLGIAADLLALDPTASLSAIAEAAGIGRTTLHKRYPKRQDLLLAVARDSIEQIELAMEETGVTADGPVTDETLRKFVEASVGLSSRIAFLFRQPTLDPVKEIEVAIERLELAVDEFIARAQRDGLLRADLPAWWVSATLNSVAYAAWESVVRGKLAPLDAPKIALETARTGLGVR
ncbi:TetR/AcrR family transcriptional regulator [Amycolatopsis albispora]|nr:TetR/AcrR family transcriptional regulator [Amycolatopsis albispora]